ncbi:MAG: hypothetical protein COA94_07265 [Rickettsiales bacterium]|nr:MAG: hypothetical protein COA94_07265 [Rickettsiales bacterium]
MNTTDNTVDTTTEIETRPDGTRIEKRTVHLKNSGLSREEADSTMTKSGEPNQVASTLAGGARALGSIVEGITGAPDTVLSLAGKAMDLAMSSGKKDDPELPPEPESPGVPDFDSARSSLYGNPFDSDSSPEIAPMPRAVVSRGESMFDIPDEVQVQAAQIRWGQAQHSRDQSQHVRPPATPSDRRGSIVEDAIFEIRDSLIGNIVGQMGGDLLGGSSDYAEPPEVT